MKFLIPAIVLTLTAVAFSAATTRPAPRKERPAPPPSKPDPEETYNTLLPRKPEEPLQPVPDVPRTFEGPSVAPAPAVAPTAALRREGSFIIDQIGHIEKLADGQQEFRFDSDGQHLAEPPCICLPNLNLMQMETAIKKNSGHLKFKISGELTEYNGRNYILVKKFVIPGPENPLRPGGTPIRRDDFSDAR